MAIALVMITAGSSASYSIVGSEYMTTVGGSRAGTLTSWIDAPGMGLTTYFLKTYADVLEKGGWPAILHQLQSYAFVGLACVCGSVDYPSRPPLPVKCRCVSERVLLIAASFTWRWVTGPRRRTRCLLELRGVATPQNPSRKRLRSVSFHIRSLI